MRKRKLITEQSLLDKTELVGECREWQGCLNSDGYGKMYWQGNFNGKVHRIMYQLVHPEEDISCLVIRHSCDNKLCINPDHLLSGTPKDNCMDRAVRQRSNVAKLSPEQVIKIRSMYSEGSYTHKQLADLFNINHRTIHYIVTYKTYKWVY